MVFPSSHKSGKCSENFHYKSFFFPNRQLEKEILLVLSFKFFQKFNYRPISLQTVIKIAHSAEMKYEVLN